MTSAGPIVVVGGGAAGVAAAEALRHEGYGGSLVLLGEEPMLPYDRPPLSKQVLVGAWDHERIQLREEKHYQGLDIRLRHAGRVAWTPAVACCVWLTGAAWPSTG